MVNRKDGAFRSRGLPSSLDDEPTDLAARLHGRQADGRRMDRPLPPIDDDEELDEPLYDRA